MRIQSICTQSIDFQWFVDKDFCLWPYVLFSMFKSFRLFEMMNTCQWMILVLFQEACALIYFASLVHGDTSFLFLAQTSFVFVYNMQQLEWWFLQDIHQGSYQLSYILCLNLVSVIHYQSQFVHMQPSYLQGLVQKQLQIMT